MIRVYRNLNTPILILGLEILDYGILAILFLILFNVSDHFLINLVILGVFVMGMRYFKKGKPQGYFLHLIQFLFKKRVGHVRPEPLSRLKPSWVEEPK